MLLKLNVTQMECHSKWNVPQYGMSLIMNVTQNGISLKKECHSKWSVTKMECSLNGMSLKIELH